MPPKRSPFLRALGQAIRAQRQAKNLDQIWLGHRAGLSPNYVSDVELGKRNISAETLGALVSALGITWIEFGAEMERVIHGGPRRQRKSVDPDSDPSE